MLPNRKKRSTKQIVLILGDLIILIVTPLLSVYVYFFLTLGFAFRLHFMKVFSLAFVSNILIFLVSFYIMGLYDFNKVFYRKREVFNIFAGICMGGIGSVLFFYAIGMPPMGRGIFFIYASISFVLVGAFRAIYSKWVFAGQYRKKAVIVGARDGGPSLARTIKTNPRLCIDVVGILDTADEVEVECVAGVPVVCGRHSLSEIVRVHRPSLLILANEETWSEELAREIIRCSQEGVEIRDLAGVYEELEGRIPLAHVSNRWLLFPHPMRRNFYFRRIKRLMDLVSAGVMLIIAAPVMLVISAAVKLESKGPVFYRQRRIGMDKREFELIKFRSMMANAEEKTGAVWASDKRDPRVTRVGRILRFLRVDELPQLFNVLKGEMSMIGPRPERPEFVSDFVGENGRKDWIIPFYSERFSLKPGITGWAQVRYPYASSREETIRKLEYDLFYIKNISFLLDFSILLRTIRVVLFGQGAR